MPQLMPAAELADIGMTANRWIGGPSSTTAVRVQIGDEDPHNEDADTTGSSPV